MSVAVTYSSAQVGISAPLITVEVDVSPGLPQVLIVGLPETAVRESKDRVRAAISSSGLSFPDKRVTVNLRPQTYPNPADATIWPLHWRSWQPTGIFQLMP